MLNSNDKPWEKLLAWQGLSSKNWANTINPYIKEKEGKPIWNRSLLNGWPVDNIIQTTNQSRDYAISYGRPREQNMLVTKDEEISSLK